MISSECSQEHIPISGLLEEFQNMTQNLLHLTDEIWLAIKVYIQVVAGLLAVESFILADYVLPKISENVLSFDLRLRILGIISIIPLILLIISWHTSKMLERSYKRFLETAGILINIRKTLKLIDLNIYPDNRIKEWAPIIKDNDFTNYISNYMGKKNKNKDTLYYQLKTLTFIMSIFSILLLLGLILLIL
jgi:hypothetical protein